jgi:hypothetical protein
VDVDQGVLYETRCQLGLSYRAASSLYNQTAVTLDYAQAHLSGSSRANRRLYIRNSVTVARKNGSSARAVDMTSRLSVSEPPTGVGTYDRAPPPSTAATTPTSPSSPYWLLALGTIDEPRYPGVRSSCTGRLISTSLGQQVSGLDTGDYLVINNPPVWLPQFDIECLTLGYTETLAKFRRR